MNKKQDRQGTYKINTGLFTEDGRFSSSEHRLVLEKCEQGDIPARASHVIKIYSGLAGIYEAVYLLPDNTVVTPSNPNIKLLLMLGLAKKVTGEIMNAQDTISALQAQHKQLDEDYERLVTQIAGTDSKLSNYNYNKLKEISDKQVGIQARIQRGAEL